MIRDITRLALPILAAVVMYGCQSGAEREAREVPAIDHLLEQAEQVCRDYNQIGFDGRFDEIVGDIRLATNYFILEPLDVSCAGNPGEYRFTIGPKGSVISRDQL
tara:strand:- start:504 stop:818 length:315 start_codon:yes stop_codon:yes gene_type:complete